MGLFYGAQVRADGHLHRVGKAQNAHGLAELCRGGLLAELVDKGGSHNGDDLCAGLDGLNELEDLALVGDGAKGAVDQTHTAGDAFIVVDLGAAHLVGADGIHAAGLGAGALNAADSVVGALVQAFAALDALALVNAALAVPDDDGALGADRLTGVGEAALAVGGDPDLLGRAGVAGKLDDVDQGRLIVFFRDVGLLNAVAGRAVLLGRTQGQAAGKPKPLGDDGSLQENIAPVFGYLAGDDLIGYFINAGVVSPFIGQTGDFFKNAFADIVDYAVDTSHFNPSVILFLSLTC